MHILAFPAGAWLEVYSELRVRPLPTALAEDGWHFKPLSLSGRPGLETVLPLDRAWVVLDDSPAVAKARDLLDACLRGMPSLAETIANLQFFTKDRPPSLEQILVNLQPHSSEDVEVEPGHTNKVPRYYGWRMYRVSEPANPKTFRRTSKTSRTTP